MVYFGKTGDLLDTEKKEVMYTHTNSAFHGENSQDLKSYEEICTKIAIIVHKLNLYSIK